MKRINVAAAYKIKDFIAERRPEITSTLVRLLSVLFSFRDRFLENVLNLNSLESEPRNWLIATRT